MTVQLFPRKILKQITPAFQQNLQQKVVEALFLTDMKPRDLDENTFEEDPSRKTHIRNFSISTHKSKFRKKMNKTCTFRYSDGPWNSEHSHSIQIYADFTQLKQWLLGKTNWWTTRAHLIVFIWNWNETIAATWKILLIRSIWNRLGWT